MTGLTLAFYVGLPVTAIGIAITRFFQKHSAIYVGDTVRVIDTASVNYEKGGEVTDIKGEYLFVQIDPNAKPLRFHISEVELVPEI